MTTPELSLVIPAFNSVRYLAGNVDRVRAFHDLAGIDGEIVVSGTNYGPTSRGRSD